MAQDLRRDWRNRYRGRLLISINPDFANNKTDSDTDSDPDPEVHRGPLRLAEQAKATASSRGRLLSNEPEIYLSEKNLSVACILPFGIFLDVSKLLILLVELTRIELVTSLLPAVSQALSPLNIENL
jgi:hypothetical protein